VRDAGVGGAGVGGVGVGLYSVTMGTNSEYKKEVSLGEVRAGSFTLQCTINKQHETNLRLLEPVLLLLLDFLRSRSSW
jgi:hypothetical protein